MKRKDYLSTPILIFMFSIFFDTDRPILGQELSYKQLYETGSIKVFRSINETTPTYKAEGTVEANIFELMAVIADIDRRKEWVSNLAEVRKVAGDVESQITLYERMNLPWPFSDRDVIVESTIEKNYKTLEIRVNYHNVNLPEIVPEKKDIIRVPLVVGGFYFKSINPQQTYCQLTIKLQLGGKIPQWLMDMIIKKIPEKTLYSLLDQVKATKGKYKEFIQKHKSLSE